MDVMPDPRADETFLALVDLGGLDELLLDGAGPTPDNLNFSQKIIMLKLLLTKTN